MRKIRQTSITTETRERLTIRRGGPHSSLYCPACGQGAPVINVDEAKMLVKMTAREIFRRAEKGEIHVVDDLEGETVICLNSLTAMDAGRHILKPPIQIPKEIKK